MLCLVGLAALWAFFIAKDVTAFRNNLVGGNPSFLLYYSTMAVISLPVVWHSLKGADMRARMYSHVVDDRARLLRGWLVTRGVLCAATVLALQIGHMAFWYRGAACSQNGAFLVDIYFKGCFANYGGLDFITMPVLAFLCVVMFGHPHVNGAAPRADAATGPGAAPQPLAPASGGRALPGAAVAAAALFVVVLSATASVAQEPVTREALPNEVTIGFRADAEPFSYQSAQQTGLGGSSKPLYKGFLADLCYWISMGAASRC